MSTHGSPAVTPECPGRRSQGDTGFPLTPALPGGKDWKQAARCSMPLESARRALVNGRRGAVWPRIALLALALFFFPMPGFGAESDSAAAARAERSRGRSALPTRAAYAISSTTGSTSCRPFRSSCGRKFFP